MAPPISSLWAMPPSRAEVSTRSRTSVSIRLRARGPEHLDLVAREVGVDEEAVADRVVDVVVDVGDPVDDAHDPALERLGILRARMGEDPVAHLVGEVELLGDPQRLLVVAEASSEALGERLVERLLAGMAEGRVPRVVPEPDRLDEVLVQLERPRHDPRDPGRLERVGHAGAVVVADRVDEDLRLPLEAAERPWSGRCGRGRAGTGSGPPTRAPAGCARASRRSARRAARATRPPAG